MQSLRKKDDIMRDTVCRRLVARISQLEGEIVQRDEERDSINNVAILNFELA